MNYPTRFHWAGRGWYSGRSDENGGERFLIARKGATLDEVNRHCRERLYDTPRLYLEKPEAKDGLWFPDEQ
jgi:hypothetical protein